MKRLIALLAISSFVVHANAVTSSNSSSTAATPEAVKKRYVINTMTTPIPAPAAEATAPESDLKVELAASTAAPQAAAAPEAELTLDVENEKAITQEVEAAEAQQIITRVEKSKTSNNNFYLTGSVGLGAYPEVNNISSGAAANVAFGYMLNRTWMLELGAGYGQYKMDSQNFTIFNRRDNYDIDQTSANLGAKYRILDGNIVPTVGAALAYTSRQFTLTNPFNSTVNQSSIDAGTTQSTDAGLTAGVDYELNDTIAFGLDLRYMFNLSNNSTAATNSVSGPIFAGSTGVSIEKLQYYNAGLSARMNF